MVCIILFGIRICIDFTAPLLIGILSLTLPPAQVWHTAAACLLHESAHILAIFITKQHPEKLNVSAAGMQLTIHRGMLCPLRSYLLILQSGPLMNLVFGLLLMHQHPEAAAAHFALFWFNLLPYRGTDGGTLLRMILEQKYEPHAETAERIAKLTALTASFVILAGMHFTEQRNLSLFVMIVYLIVSEFM